MIGRRHHSRPVTRRGTGGGVCMLAVCTLLLAPRPLSAAPPTIAVRPTATPAIAADTLPDGPTTEVVGRVFRQEARSGIGQAQLLFHRMVGDSVIDTRTVVTGDDGRFRIDYLPSGTYTLTITHLGYEARHDTLKMPFGKRVELKIPLATEPVSLEPLNVDVRSDWLVETGFYDRQEKGLGRFLTPEELEKRPLSSLTEALKTVPGVKEVNSCRGLFCNDVIRMSLSRGKKGCSVKFFMDGNEMHGTVHPDNISVHDVAAVEIYRGISETPGQFYGRCGSVVIWSKRAGS